MFFIMKVFAFAFLALIVCFTKASVPIFNQPLKGIDDYTLCVQPYMLSMAGGTINYAQYVFGIAKCAGEHPEGCKEFCEMAIIENTPEQEECYQLCANPTEAAKKKIRQYEEQKNKAN